MLEIRPISIIVVISGMIKFIFSLLSVSLCTISFPNIIETQKSIPVRTSIAVFQLNPRFKRKVGKIERIAILIKVYGRMTRAYFFSVLIILLNSKVELYKGSGCI
jgi:uncharacterized membrane protein